MSSSTWSDQREEQHPTVLILLSGGVDSAGCAAFYLSQQLGVRALFVDYGQPAASREWESAREVAAHFGLTLHRAVVRGLEIPPSGFVAARNALLVAMALASPVAPVRGLVALAVHADTPYPDCKPGFIEAVQSLADVYSAGKVQVVSPFLEWSKAEIVRYALESGVPLDATYSCEAGGGEPCGVCLSCKDRLRTMP